MSEPGALGIYQQSNRVPPAHVSDRPWLGVNWGGDGRPEGFGQSLLAGLIGSRGDLRQFARDWIPADAPVEGEEYPHHCDPENDLGNTCYCYVIDLEQRRLDVFGTYAGAEGVLLGSLTIGADGVPEPASFEHLVRPTPWQPWDDQVFTPEWGVLIDNSVAEGCRALGLDVEIARSLLKRGSELEAQVNPKWRVRDEEEIGGWIPAPSIYSFWRAADEHGVEWKLVLTLLDRVGSDIMQHLNADRRFMMVCDVAESSKAELRTYILQRELTPEQREQARTDSRFLHQVSEPWLSSDWRDPLIGWTQSVQSAERVAAPPAADSKHRKQLAAAIAGVCQARSLSPRQLTEGFAELLEEFLLQEAWQPPANDDELPEEWPALWNPLCIGGSRGQPDLDGRIQFSNLSFSFPKPSAEAWPRLVFFRADGARAISRLSPFKLAQQGPRTWGNAKAVLSELFGAIGSVVEGNPVQVDARGVLLCKFGEEWRPLTNKWSYWLHLFEWMESVAEA